MILLTVRSTIGSYIDTLLFVYILLIFAYIVVNWILVLGVRLPYSRATDAVIGFLREVCDPYLGLFRRILPPFGGIDFSPMIAIIVLYVVRDVVSNLFSG